MIHKTKTARKVSWIISYQILLLFLCSCFYSPSKEKSVYYNDRVDLLVLYKYSVPFVGESYESVGGIEIYPVEVDDYGRTLGIMQGDQIRRAPLFGENAVYCVLQGGSKNECCFYEDGCCVMLENASDYHETIDQLKKTNDWNKPLALEQCRTIPIKNYSASGVFDTDLNYQYNSLADMVCKAVGCSTDNTWLDEISKDGCGLWLFALMLDLGKEDSPVYLVMMQENLSSVGNDKPELSVIGTHLLEKHTSPWEEIHTFKEDMGWQFVNPAQSK